MALPPTGCMRACCTLPTYTSSRSTPPAEQKSLVRPGLTRYMHTNNMLATKEELARVLAEALRPDEELADVRDAYDDWGDALGVVSGFSP